MAPETRTGQGTGVFHSRIFSGPQSACSLCWLLPHSGPRKQHPHPLHLLFGLSSTSLNRLQNPYWCECCAMKISLKLSLSLNPTWPLPSASSWHWGTCYFRWAARSHRACIWMSSLLSMSCVPWSSSLPSLVLSFLIRKSGNPGLLAKIRSERVCEHTYFVMEKTHWIWKEVGAGRERGDEERKCFQDWELFDTYGTHLITSCKDESISMRIITINS